MRHIKFDLRNEPINGFMPTLTAYIIDDCTELKKSKKKPAVLICPGGGYSGCSIREGEPVALQYMAAGYHAFVLNYATAPHNYYPEPFKNVSDAIVLIRDHADEWHLDSNKIAVAGFSAGGHLAATLATLWNTEPMKTDDRNNRPDAAILCYPVISSDDTIAHKGSFDNLCRDDIALRKSLSLETRVTADTPPCFLWHTFDDDTVPVENSLRFATALKKAGVSCEMHIFPSGVHGLSVSNIDTAPIPECINKRAADWIELSVKWLNDLFEKEKM
ncbi:MAG: alpha/beta hydrolase [Clostridia bacterium]|nr:alpha/beta hydrolase [Clostridia bacterium]